jgi:hypothetical protein
MEIAKNKNGKFLFALQLNLFVPSDKMPFAQKLMHVLRLNLSIYVVNQSKKRIFIILWGE